MRGKADADMTMQIRVAILLTFGLAGLTACGAAGDECAFGPLQVEPFSGSTVTTTSFTCSGGEHWMCFDFGPGAIIYFSESAANCGLPIDDRVIEFQQGVEQSGFVRWTIRFDADGRPVAAGAQTGERPDYDSARPALGGSLSLEGNAVSVDDCARGHLRLELDTVVVDGTFMTQVCTY